MRTAAILDLEVLWKGIRVLVVAVPMMWRGDLTPEVSETLFAFLFAVPFLFVVPWRPLTRDVLGGRESRGGAPTAK